MSNPSDQGSIEWVTLDEAPNHPAIRQLIPTQRSWYWQLGQERFKRAMVEAGALIKIGKSWRVSTLKAPATIEQIFRESSLAALDRATAKPRTKRADRAQITA